MSIEEIHQQKRRDREARDERLYVLRTLLIMIGTGVILWALDYYREWP